MTAKEVAAAMVVDTAVVKSEASQAARMAAAEVLALVAAEMRAVHRSQSQPS